MKKSFIVFILFLFSVLLSAQSQLDIQGDSTSTETVAKIKANYSGAGDVFGLLVVSQPDSTHGIAGGFYGGLHGVVGTSVNGNGVWGESSLGTGVAGVGGEYGVSGNGGMAGVKGASYSGHGIRGESTNSYGISGISEDSTGAYFKGGNGVAIELGGVDSEWGFGNDDAVIRSETAQAQGDLILVSNDVIALHLDDDNTDSNSRLEVSNGLNDLILKLDESGNMNLSGYLHIGNPGGINELIAVYGHSQDSTGGFFKGEKGVAVELGGVDSEWGSDNDDAVIRSDRSQSTGDLILVSNDVIALYLDDDNNSSSRLEVRNDANTRILNLDESGNLTLDGACSCSSDRHRKEKITPVNPEHILAKLATLPISQWQFKGESARHIGPMAQDFYALFGLGQEETTIATVDADGVALASIQALKKEIDDLEDENKALEDAIEQLKKLVLNTRD